MRTPEGTERSSRNATKHGLCSNRLLLPDEDPLEWQQIKQGWLDDYCPQTHTALTLVLQAAEGEWLFLRARRRFHEAEQDLYREQRNPLAWTEEQQKKMDRFARYRTTYERSFQRALRNLEDLRRSRSLEAARISQAEFRMEMAAHKANAARSAPRNEESKPPKKKTGPPPPPLEQWVEVTIQDGKPVTTLYPSNDELLQDVQKMDPPPDLVYRRLNFVNGIPPEYHWTAESTPELFETGGCGIQRLQYDVWLQAIERERTTGHLGPTGVGNLPRPQHRGGCDCPVCSHNRELLEQRKLDEVQHS